MYEYILIYLYIHMTSTQIPCSNVCVQPTATHCNSLQLTATHIHMYTIRHQHRYLIRMCVCNLHHTATHIYLYIHMTSTQVPCSHVCVQQTAIPCNTPQYTATHIHMYIYMALTQIPYSTVCVQHNATQCNTHTPVYLYDITTGTLSKCVCATSGIHCNSPKHTATHIYMYIYMTLTPIPCSKCRRAQSQEIPRGS